MNLADIGKRWPARALAALAGLLACAVAACVPVPPAVVTSPHFPNYQFPAVPDALAGTLAAERHAEAWRFLQVGDLRNAERSFSAIVDRNPLFYPALAGLGFVELAQQNHADAIERFGSALAQAPAYTPALIGRGETLLVSARETDALRDFEAALAIDPSLADVRRRVEVLRFRQIRDAVAQGRTAAEAGRLNEAREAFTRAIAASPESPALYRELATVEQRAGNLDAALAHVAKALELDATDARAAALLGQLHEAGGNLVSAERAFTGAYELAPTDNLRRKLADVRNRLRLAGLPIEYSEIGDTPRLTRGAMAALVGVRLESLLRSTPRQPSGIVTDTRSHWASPWILNVLQSGVMDAYPNHTFQPDAPVRRDGLAQVVSRLLALLAQRAPEMASEWSSARPAFSDLPPGHLSYAAASMAVSAGVLTPLNGGTFQLGRPVSGAEAVAAIDRLEALAARARQP